MNGEEKKECQDTSKIWKTSFDNEFQTKKDETCTDKWFWWWTMDKRHIHFRNVTSHVCNNLLDLKMLYVVTIQQNLYTCIKLNASNTGWHNKKYKLCWKMTDEFLKNNENYTDYSDFTRD